jgi:WW domain-containing oxidoreductase
MPKKLQFEKFPLGEDNFKMMLAYGQAKLCNVLMANELQRRYADQGLAACSLHPGNLVTTDIARRSGIMSILMKVISPITKTPNQGAGTSVYCAVHEPAEEVRGLYFSHCKAVKSTTEANDPAVASKLWDLSEAWCEANAPVAP